MGGRSVIQPYLPHHSHARAFLGIGAFLLLGMVVTARTGPEYMPIVLGALAVTPLAIGVVLWFVANRWLRAAQTLIAGSSILRWEYQTAEWGAFVASEAEKQPPTPWVLGGLFTVSGLVAAMLDQEEKVFDFQPAVLGWVVLPSCGAAIGVLIGSVVNGFRRARLARMRSEPGICCLGSEGLYLTGSYWPLAGATTRVLGLEQVDRTLVFRFASGRQVLKVRVPIAAGKDAEAAALVARIGAAQRDAGS